MPVLTTQWLTNFGPVFRRNTARYVKNVVVMSLARVRPVGLIEDQGQPGFADCGATQAHGETRFSLLNCAPFSDSQDRTYDSSYSIRT